MWDYYGRKRSGGTGTCYGAFTNYEIFTRRLLITWVRLLRKNRWSNAPFALPPPRWEEFYSNLNFFKAQTSCYLFELFLCSTPYFRICYRNRASLEISCRGFFRTSSHLYYFIDFSLLFFENFRNFSLHIRSPPLLFCCPSITKQSGGSIWLL